MKGMVFTEFLEMVDAQHGATMVDRIIAAADLPNDGAYTSVGIYDHRELVRLVAALSEATGVPVPTLVRCFGERLLQRFLVAYPGFFAESKDSFALLSHIDGHIHVEVRKLYPDAQLPRFSCEHPNANELVMLYASPRGFADLAEGLIQGCIAHYREQIRLTRVDLPTIDGEQRVQFHLVRLAP
jgi:hypothetical protein